MDLNASLQGFLIKKNIARRAPPTPNSAEPAVNEQQLDAWETNLTTRAAQSADALRSLAAECQTLVGLAARLSQRGVPPTAEVQQAMSLLLPSGRSASLLQALEAAELARQQALELRVRAARAWEHELALEQRTMEEGRAVVGHASEWAKAELNRPAPVAAPPIRLTEPVVSLGSPKVTQRPHAQPESRTHARLPLAVAIDFESDHNFYTGVSTDISEGGLFVATQNIRPLGAVLDLELALPSGCRIHVAGRVRWVREVSPFIDASTPSGMGVQFEGLSPEASHTIARFLGQRDPILYED